MSTDRIFGPALLRATLLGTALQVAMVIAGHYVPTIAMMFGILGATFSLVAGLAYARWARQVAGRSGAVGGAIAGGVCALLGIAISVALGDVPALILAFGTASSTATGALGGATGSWLNRRSALSTGSTRGAA